MKTDSRRQLNTIRLSCYGVRIAVAVDSSVPVTAVQSLLPSSHDDLDDREIAHHFSLLYSSTAPSSSYLLERGGSRVTHAWTIGDALRALRRALHLCVAEHSREAVFVHAGAVAWNGRAVVCPGRSFSGKSTLIWSMLKSGATYYSDEYAVLDATGAIHPFCIPLSLRTSENEHSILPERAGFGPAAVSLILFAQFRPNHTWAPRAISPEESMLLLLRNSLSMRRNPAFVLRVLKTVALSTHAYVGKRGDADQILQWLQALGACSLGSAGDFHGEHRSLAVT